LLERRYQRLQGVNEIHISAYPEVSIPSDIDLSSIAAELGASITIQTFGHFRWHRTAPRNDRRVTDRIFSTCQLFHSWQCHTLRKGWFYACPPAATWASSNAEGVDLLGSGSDCGAKITRLLSQEVPFVSCNECLGSAGQRFEHRLGWRRSRDVLPTPPLDTHFLGSLELDPDTHNECFEYERTIHPSGQVELHRGGE
jgi:hypothetical protein